MKAQDRRICPSCGNEFSGAVEFCPVCMLRGVLDEEVGIFSEQAFNEPTVEPSAPPSRLRSQDCSLATLHCLGRRSLLLEV